MTSIAPVSPRTVARSWLALGLGANAVLVTVLFAAAGTSVNLLITVGRLLGLYGALLLAFQLLLVARLGWLDRRLGMDRLTGLHRWTGFTLVWLLVGHAVFITYGYASSEQTSPVPTFVELAETTDGILRAILALLLIMGVGALSVRYARRRLAYETWHFIHLYSYLAVVLAFSHQIATGQTFVGSDVARVYWWTLWGATLGAVLLGRVLIPLRRNARHRLRVSHVVSEAPDVVSVYVTGRHLAELPARAGQFFLWRFLTRDRWWQANPYSLSAAPDGKSLRLTAKALGDGSAGLRRVRPGTWVFAEGPYGAFTGLHRQAANALLIAGGVGITPIRALLEELSGHLVVVYRVNSTADAVLMAELSALAHRRGAVLHLLVGPPDARGANGLPLLAPANLATHVPDIRQRDVFVCGPPGLTDAVLTSLRRLQVPPGQVHAERFSLAG